jgi:hypothetical protein
VITVIARAYGFEVGREVRYPRRIMGYLGPVLAERDLWLRAASIAAERLWRFLCERRDLVPAILPGVDREALLYASRDAIFDNRKIRALGFEFRYRSIAEGYPGVLAWFQERRWVPKHDPHAAREWGAAVGFKFDETMAGTWRRGPDAAPRPFQFTCIARASNGRQFARDGLLELEGKVSADGLARERPLKGTLDMSWRQKRELAYDFTFTGDDAKPYRFVGRKDVRLLRLIETMTTLPGRILDGAGAEVGTAIAYFDLRKDLLSLVGSFSAVAAGAPAAVAATAT